MSRLNQLLEWIEEDSSDPFLHFALAKEYEKSDDFAQALKSYQHLHKNFKDYVGTYYHLGKLHESMNAPQLAITVYQEGIDLCKTIGDQHAMSELMSAKQNCEIEL